jgi:Tol biopolymer transport system component
MTPERWRQIEQIYHAALDRRPQSRDMYVEEECAGDPSLIAEVNSLLARDASDRNALLNQPARQRDGSPHLAPGGRLGPYEIGTLIGSGGMGDVYLARDSKLKRLVALKVLPEAFATDPERMARFEHEARVLASLNHPHIAQIYGVEDGALAMELVTGESPKGPMPFDEAWKIAAQIADALEYAHERGIVHRDLKPANIKITTDGMVKLLDFGLAKSFPTAGLPAESAAHGPAPMADPTMPGVILGTASYMAPEQVMGKSADQRADIWAFGVVLYELLAGRRPFRGDGVPQIMAAVIRDEPDLTPIPSRARPLIELCLQKDPKKRLRHIGDAVLLLEGETRNIPDKHRNAVPIGVLAIVTLLLGALAMIHFGEAPPRLEPVRTNILLPEKSRVRALAVSPDGRQIAAALVKDGKQQIWVRALDSLDFTPLAGTDGAASPFWSPDSRYIGFFAEAKVKKIERSGGPVQTLCDAIGGMGGTWNRTGDILFSTDALGRVQRVPDSGGPPSDVPHQPGTNDFYPFFLPDGEHYLVRRSRVPGPADSGIWLSSIASAESRQILPDFSKPEFVEGITGSNAGQVLFTRNGTLMGLPFDTKALGPAGNARPVAQPVAELPGDWTFCRGLLAYLSGKAANWQYVWRDRTGRNLGAAAGDAGAVAGISPDGRRLVGGSHGIDVLDLASGADTQITFGGAGQDPIWSPDGRYVAYGGVGGIYRKLASGAGVAELLISGKGLMVPKSWSPDGRFILYDQLNPGTGVDMLAIPMDGERKPFVVVQTPANEDQGQFSPDGHWIAYTSNESGVSEIYVVPFPPSEEGGKWMVSHGGGVQPRWNRNGKELFYISPDSKMISVVTTRPAFQTGVPRSLFLTDLVDTGIRNGPMSWDVAPDGNRFLIISDSSTDSSLTVVLNWQTGPK